MRGVDLHLISLNADPAPFDALLSPDERERAARFYFDHDRSRYVICRGNLRRRLAGHLAIAPAAVEFSYNPQGKPETAGVHFNASHSGDYALIAISETRVVGVDIESMSRSFASDRIPERFFSPVEVRALRALPEPDQLQAFFNCWTRKEAYVKARGLGLSLDLKSFDVSIDERAEFLRGAEGWEIEAVAAPQGYAAAVVASSEILTSDS
jgi:4'-phosphopantetheinyl transferase